MKAFVLVLGILSVGVRPVNAAAAEGIVNLSMDSTRYCFGASWNLKVSNAAPNSAIRLIGTSNNIPWEMPHWADTDAGGNFSASGTYVADAQGRHTVRAEIAGSMSSILPIEVLSCGWRSTGSLNAPRFSPTATLLNDGKVLIAGGYSSWIANPPYGSVPDQWQQSAELYDPASETWSVTGKLNEVRVGHTATLLPNGKVLVAGGWISSPYRVLSSAELYDPASGAWSPAGRMNSPRSDQTATLLPDGKVLIAGGYSDYPRGLFSAELYDPVTGSWTATSNLITGRGGHTATLLPNGKVLVVGGGRGDHCQGLADAELYDPATRLWSATGSVAAARESLTATLLADGKVLVSDIPAEPGCNDRSNAELYDSAAGTWSITGKNNVLHYSYDSPTTLLPNGNVLLADSRFTELYDSSTGTWSPGASFSNTAPWFSTATLLHNGRVLMAGGTSTAALYDGGFETPLITLNSATYCVGDAWRLTVSRAARSAPVRLMGTSNGTSWEIAQWGVTDADASFNANGAFADDTVGTHTLRVEVRGVRSLYTSFEVAICKP